ncbi:hypothetical protein ALP10_00332, partial [Pseudomonas syringae pv. helianthi]
NASYKGCDAFLRSMSMCEHEGEKQRKFMAVLLFSVITGCGLPSNDSGDGFPFDLLAMSHVLGRLVTPVRK